MTLKLTGSKRYKVNRGQGVMSGKQIERFFGTRFAMAIRAIAPAEVPVARLPGLFDDFIAGLKNHGNGSTTTQSSLDSDEASLATKEIAA